MDNNNGYKIRRKDLLVNTTRNIVAFGLRHYHNISYQNIENLQGLNGEGFVLLPKHQSVWDIILEGMLLNDVLGRNANYLMKDSLSKFYEHLGGISITRGKEVLKNGDREAAIKAARAREDKVYNEIVPSLLSRGEIMVVHPEATRSYKKPFKANYAILRKLMASQKELKKQITFVPLNIVYEDRSMPFSKIMLTVGPKTKVPDDGIEELVEHLKATIKETPAM